MKDAQNHKNADRKIFITSSMSLYRVIWRPSNVSDTEASLRTCSAWEKKAASLRTAVSSEGTEGDETSKGEDVCQLPVTSPENTNTEGFGNLIFYNRFKTSGDNAKCKSVPWIILVVTRHFCSVLFIYFIYLLFGN